MVLRRAETYVAEALQEVDDNERSSWYNYETAQHTAMNTIIAAAKTYEIEPFSQMIVPQRKNFGSDQFNDFKVDLDHYTAQLLLDNSIRSKRDAVEIDQKHKSRIRGHIHAIRELIDKADMPETKRALLLKRLSELEIALEKPRVNIVGLSHIIVAIFACTASVTQIADSAAIHKLVTTIMATIGEAKAIDEEKRELPLPHPPQPLLPPRPSDYAAKSEKSHDSSEGNLDDEIPF